MKAMPFHEGHRLVVDFGYDALGSMDVIVSGKVDDAIPLDVRFGWVRQHYASYPQVRVHRHVDDIVAERADQRGTVIGEEFWDRWIMQFRRFSPGATHFVSSDWYGKKAAELLGIEWLPVDPDRLLIPVSATMIRNNPGAYFGMITEVARPWYRKKVVVVGAESTGKSTIVRQLAKRYDTVGVPEYGRTISEAQRNQLTISDFDNIVRGHARMICLAEKRAGRVMFVDTEAYTSSLFSEVYLGYPNALALQKAESQQYDLYLLMSPETPWVDDGERVLSEQNDRIAFTEKLLSFIVRRGARVSFIHGESHEVRFLQAVGAIEEMLAGVDRAIQPLLPTSLSKV